MSLLFVPTETCPDCSPLNPHWHVLLGRSPGQRALCAWLEGGPQASWPRNAGGCLPRRGRRHHLRHAISYNTGTQLTRHSQECPLKPHPPPTGYPPSCCCGANYRSGIKTSPVLRPNHRLFLCSHPQCGAGRVRARGCPVSSSMSPWGLLGCTQGG